MFHRSKIPVCAFLVVIFVVVSASWYSSWNVQGTCWEWTSWVFHEAAARCTWVSASFIDADWCKFSVHDALTADSLVYCCCYYYSTTTTTTVLQPSGFCLGLPSTRKVKPIWILLEQETASGSCISLATCNSAPRPRQITTPVLHHSVFHRPDAFPVAQLTGSKHCSAVVT